MAKIPESVATFLQGKRIAVAGVSRQPGQAANAVFRKLRGSGYEVFAINPKASEVEGVTCYRDVAAVPVQLDGVVIATAPDVSVQVVRQCSDQGVRRVWFHRSFGTGSVSDEAVRECSARGVDCIVGGCPLMFCDPVDLGHKCVRWWLQRKGRVPLLVLTLVVPMLAGCAKPQTPKYDVVIRHGTIYDGTGVAGHVGDVAILDDRIAATGDLSAERGREEIDATGLAVAPGFINMLSHSETSLIEDGRSQGALRQGVTLEVYGESSMGPLTEQMKKDQMERQGDIKFNITWNTLGGYLDHLVARGISTNVASFVSAATVRANEIGLDNRPPTPEELERMRAHVRVAMDEGAMGLTTALIYIPGVFAKTDEIVELAKVASQSGGMYISHMRSEGNRLLEAIDETLTIAREAHIRAEIYHLKASGESNWNKLDAVIAKVDAANKAGLEITADMYTYTAGSTGLDAAMPPWVQEGGYKAWAKRLQDPKIRARVRREMTTPSDAWENLMFAAGGQGTLLVGFKNEALRIYAGKTLAEVGTLRGKSIQDTAMDLVVEDGSRVQVVYFLMSEENVKRQIALPWVSFGSDAASMAPEGVFVKTSTHPRAYGNFARLLGKYVRDEHVIPMEEAIRKLTLLPASTLRIKERGRLEKGYFADVVVFDPKTIADRSTYEKPHQYATGVRHVWVNGGQVLKDGEHTGQKPGRVVRGPGWKPKG